jgi:excisionase family DNA binding protein
MVSPTHASGSAPPDAGSAESSALEQLRAYFREMGSRAGSKVHELHGPSGESLVLPRSLLEVLMRATEEMARGATIVVVPVERELTTQEAADLLNVSRQYLVRLVDEGKLSCVRTGSHRRLRREEVLRFKAERDREREETLDALTQLHEDLGGYDR